MEGSEEALRTLQRPINCLLDEDRNTRKSGLTTVLAWLKASPPPPLALHIFERHLLRNISHCLQDKIQKNRELALDITSRLVGLGVPPLSLSSDTVTTTVNVLRSRLDKRPYPEGSEQLRLAGLRIIAVLLQHYSHQLVPTLAQFSHMLSIILKDQNPDMKKELPAFIRRACFHFKSRLGGYSAGIARSLAENIVHQQNRVRKLSLEAVSPLLLCENGGAHFPIIEPMLKIAAIDKIKEVRKSAYEVVGQLLRGFGIAYLNKHEAVLVTLLIGGLDDECEELKARAKQLMAICGEQIKTLVAGESEGKMLVEGV